MRRPPIPSLLAALVLAAGCAQGSDGSDGTAPRDGGGPEDAPASDGGGGDAAVPTCTDEGHGASCDAPTDLGAIDPGGEASSMIGYLPTTGAEDWFLVGFPSLGMPNLAGGGEPRIELSMNENDAFRFEVRATCSATLACGDGAGARDLRSWSFVDDRSPMDAEATGEMDYSTRDVPWPSPVHVRVYRTTGAGDCSRYQLRASR